MKKVACFLPLVLCALAYGFEWPADGVTAETVRAYYGALRGGTINSSVVLEGGGQYKASDDGRVTVVLEDHTNDFGWFCSALGTAVVIEHADDLATVYGNLDEATLSSGQLSGMITSGTPIGSGGASAWHEEEASGAEGALEFKAFDNANTTSVNPLVLMPRLESAAPLAPEGITLTSADGNSYTLSVGSRVPAGVYSVYRAREGGAAPYRTSVSVNGVTSETISYDVLEGHGRLLCARGTAYYSVSDIYPDDARQLAGHATLMSGEVVLTVTLTDATNTSRDISFRLEVY